MPYCIAEAVWVNVFVSHNMVDHFIYQCFFSLSLSLVLYCDFYIKNKFPTYCYTTYVYVFYQKLSNLILCFFCSESPSLIIQRYVFLNE